jgi:hypothetical protein
MILTKPQTRPMANPELRSNHLLNVVAVVSNPLRFQSRYRLYEEFAARMATTPEVNLVTVEAAFGERQHEVTSAGDPNHVQVRHHTELWGKENLINVGIRALHRDWRYVAYIDADVMFLNKDWAQETLHQLQHHRGPIQLFENAIDLGPRNNVVQTHTGLGKLYATGAPKVFNAGPYGAAGGTYMHPGYAWAMKREFFENVGGLLDKAIVGSGDHHMSLGLIGEAHHSLPGGPSAAYRRMVMDWQARALKAAGKDIGYVEGTIMHSWHGPKAKRGYHSRWKIIVDNQYDPEVDVRYTTEGVLELVGNKPKLRDDLRRYFRSRSEDSLDE